MKRNPTDGVEEVKMKERNEALLLMIRMAVRDGSPDDDKIRFAVQDEADETSCIASKRRPFQETSKGCALSMVRLAVTRSERQRAKVGLRLATAIKAGPVVGGEVPGTLAVTGTPGRSRPELMAAGEAKTLGFGAAGSVPVQ